MTTVLTLNSFYGDDTVFISAASGATPPPPPSPASHLFVLSAFPGANTLTLFSSDPAFKAACPPGAPCTVALGVFSPTGSAFSVALDPALAPTILFDRVPLTRAAAPNGTAFFAYTPLAPATVNITLTVFAGAPSLFVAEAPGGAAGAAPLLPGPGSGAWTWSALAGPGGAEVVALSISPSDPGYLPPLAPPFPTFYIGVGAGAAGAGAATFSILALTAAGGPVAPIALVDGEPQGGAAAAHAMAYYTLDLAGTEGSAGGFDAWAVPVAGAVGVYVAAAQSRAAPLIFPTPFCLGADPVSGHCQGWGATPGSYNWSSEGAATAGLVSLPPGTFQQPTPNLPLLVVAVLAASPDDPVTGAPPPPSTFAVTGATGGRLIQLQGGVPVPGAVAAARQPGSSKYYAYTPSQPNADLTVALTVSAGRLEVYAAEFAAGGPALHPGPGASTWNSIDQDTHYVRDRVLRIPWAQLSPSCQAAVAAGRVGACGIAIAVMGTTMMAPMNAAYSILAVAGGSPSQPIALPNGAFETVALQPLSCAFLLSRAPLAGAATAAFLTVDNLVGTTELYVNVGEGRGGFWIPQNPNPAAPGANGADYYARDAGGFERVIARLNASTNLYATVCAVGAAGAQAVVGFHTGGALVPLQGGVPAFGAALPGTSAYYSFAVTDPSANLTIAVQRLDTAMMVYVTLENPRAPWVLPSPSTATWSFYPSPVSPSLAIPPGACVPGAPGGLPACTYYIAVVPSEGLDASWLVTASADPLALPSLFDGVPVDGTVGEGALSFYQYQPAVAGFPAPEVGFSWTNLLGNIAMYVTNRYVQGASPITDLPGPGSTSACQWVCTNFTGCGAAPGDPCYAPFFPLGSGTPVVYTVAVTGATGTPGASSVYSLAATNAGDTQLLRMGTPVTDIVVRAGTNTTFVFELGLGSARDDIAVSATVNHGSVYMLVAPERDRSLAVQRGVPACIPNAPGARLYCDNFTWWASSGIGDSVLYIPGDAPCAPIAPPGTPPPRVDPTCAASFPGRLNPGRYYVTIYALVHSELSLLAMDFARAVPRVVLTDGQPQLLQTGPLLVCPGAQRDNSTGACPASAVATPTLGSVAAFRVPAGSSVPFVSVTVERLCGGNRTGECGTPLWLGVSGCAEGLTCGASSLIPYASDAALHVPMWDAVASFTLPYDFCWNATASGPLPQGGVPCYYAIGVWPTTNLTSGAPPGVGVAPATYRLTMTTPLGTPRVAQDCPGSGKTGARAAGRRAAPAPPLRVLRLRLGRPRARAHRRHRERLPVLRQQPRRVRLPAGRRLRARLGAHGGQQRLDDADQQGRSHSNKNVPLGAGHVLAGRGGAGRGRGHAPPLCAAQPNLYARAAARPGAHAHHLGRPHARLGRGGHHPHPLLGAAHAVRAGRAGHGAAPGGHVFCGARLHGGLRGGPRGGPAGGAQHALRRGLCAAQHCAAARAGRHRAADAGRRLRGRAVQRAVQGPVHQGLLQPGSGGLLLPRRGPAHGRAALHALQPGGPERGLPAHTGRARAHAPAPAPPAPSASSAQPLCRAQRGRGRREGALLRGRRGGRRGGGAGPAGRGLCGLQVPGPAARLGHGRERGRGR